MPCFDQPISQQQGSFPENDRGADMTKGGRKKEKSSSREMVIINKIRKKGKWTKDHLLHKNGFFRE